MADIHPQKNTLENFEAKQEAQALEKSEKQSERSENFRKSEVWKKLKNILWTENGAVYERLVTILSTGEWEISKKEVEEKLNTLFSSPEMLTQLWLSFNETNKNELIKKIIDETFSSVDNKQENTDDSQVNIEKDQSTDLESIMKSPSFPVIQRLIDEWIISNNEAKDFWKTLTSKTQDSIDKDIDSFVKEKIKWSQTLQNEQKENILHWLSPEKITPDNFSKSSFASNFIIPWTEWEKPEFTDFHKFLWENYINIPDKWEDKKRGQENDEKMMYDRCLNKILKEMPDAFEKQKENGELILKIKNADNNKEKYTALKELFSNKSEYQRNQSKQDEASRKSWEKWKVEKKDWKLSEVQRILKEAREKFEQSFEKNNENLSVISEINNFMQELSIHEDFDKIDEYDKKMEQLIQTNASIDKYSELLQEIKDYIEENNTN